MSAMTTTTTSSVFPQFLDIPFVALRSFAEQCDMESLVNLVLANKRIGKVFEAFCKNIQVGGYNVHFNGMAGVEVPSRGYRYLWEGDSNEVVSNTVLVFGHLFSRFPGHLDSLSVDTGYLEELLEYSSFGECNRLEITSVVQADDCQAKLDALMAPLHIRESFLLDVPDCRVDIDKIAHLEHVELRGQVPWFTGADLRRFNAKTLVIGETPMTSENLNGFLMRWKNVEVAPKLELLCLDHCKVLNDWTIPAILAGIPVESFDPTRRNPIYPAAGWAFGIDMTDAFDIRRADGLVASVKMTNSRLFIVVWKSEAVEEQELKRKVERIEEEIAQEQNKIDRNDRWMQKQWTNEEKPTAKRVKTELEEALIEENARIRETIAGKQKELDALKK